MSRYIDADALYEVVTEKYYDMGAGSYPYNIVAYDMAKLVKNAPTADVVEVRHGEWEIKSRSYRMIDDYDEEIYVECPFCKRTFYVPYEFDDEKTIAYARENYPYCHCGAKMDGERRANDGT